MKILILALSGIGDALMFSPALRYLRQHLPNAHIEILTMFKGAAELYSRNPDADEVIYHDFLKKNIFSSLFFVLKLRKKKYNISINVYPSNRWPYNLISLLIGAKKRLGHDYKHVNLRSLNFLNNLRIKENDELHNVEENVNLTQLLGISAEFEKSSLQVPLTQRDKEFAKKWFTLQDIKENSLLIGFHAGSATFKNQIRKRWALEKYAELGKLLIEQFNATILLFGGHDEYALNESINKMMNSKGIVVQTNTLMESVAVMSKCSVFVSNDTGLMHIAAGLQLPIVQIVAYTNPKHTYPWNTRYISVRLELECSPCFYYSPRPVSCKLKEDKYKCINQIKVEDVFTAVRELLKEKNSSKYIISQT